MDGGSGDGNEFTAFVGIDAESGVFSTSKPRKKIEAVLSRALPWIHRGDLEVSASGNKRVFIITLHHAVVRAALFLCVHFITEQKN